MPLSCHHVSRFQHSTEPTRASCQGVSPDVQYARNRTEGLSQKLVPDSGQILFMTDLRFLPEHISSSPVSPSPISSETFSNVQGAHDAEPDRFRALRKREHESSKVREEKKINALFFRVSSPWFIIAPQPSSTHRLRSRVRVHLPLAAGQGDVDETAGVCESLLCAAPVTSCQSLSIFVIIGMPFPPPRKKSSRATKMA